MKISYRVTSFVVLVVTAGLFAVPDSLMVRPPSPSTASENGTISFDPCFVWKQIGWLVRLAALTWIGTFLPLWVQGLRNRTLPRIMAVISTVAFGWNIGNEGWHAPCASHTGIGLSAIWVAAVVLMCLHHIFQRPVRTEAAITEESL